MICQVFFTYFLNFLTLGDYLALVQQDIGCSNFPNTALKCDLVRKGYDNSHKHLTTLTFQLPLFHYIYYSIYEVICQGFLKKVSARAVSKIFHFWKILEIRI